MFNKRHLSKKRVFLALPFFPVSIWKNLGQGASTVCPTADEGQQLMLSHIPAHLPGGSKETPSNFSQRGHTMQHLPAMQHRETSPRNATARNSSQGPRQLWEQRYSVPWKASWMRQNKSCYWDLDGTEQVLLASRHTLAGSRPVPLRSLTALVSTSWTEKVGPWGALHQARGYQSVFW